MSSTSNSDMLIKPMATAAVAVALDQFILKESNMQKSIYLGVASGIGAGAGSFVASSLPGLNFGNETYFGNGKGLSQRLAEVTIGTGASFVLNQYVLKNSGFRDNYMSTIGVILASDLAGEYISDFFAGRLLAIFE